jgi:hypothetical protein
MNSYYEKLKQGLTGAVTVAAAAARQTAEVAKNLAEEITSFKALKDYKLAGHVATAGPGGSWKIFHALNKKPGEHVWCLSASSYTELAQAKWHGLWVNIRGRTSCSASYVCCAAAVLQKQRADATDIVPSASMRLQVCRQLPYN